MRAFVLEDFEDLVSLLESFSGSPVLASVDWGGRFFATNDDNSLDIMLRFTLDSVVLARFSVPTPRTGQGRQIVEWLSNFARLNKMDYVSIENPLTPESQSFCEKYGFEPEMQNTWLTNFKLKIN